MSPGISVVICCYNGSSRITPTLQHLAVQQNIAVPNWEVIIVDNGSTDNTAEIARLVWESIEQPRPSFNIVQEPVPGLSAARQRGFSEARFNYIVFCDDDNWLDARYVSTALEIMQSDTLIGALGATGSPVFEGKEPPYFWINQYHTLAVGAQFPKEGDITAERGVVYGAGMVINKLAYNILKDQYDFRFQLSDRIGTFLVSSGDHELCLAFKKIGYKIFCSQRLQFRHYIPTSRTSIPYYKKLFLGFGISYALLHVYRVTEENINDLANDYRYICLRAFKNICILQVKLFFNGYYFNHDPYKSLDIVHQLYNNIGIYRTFRKVRNAFKRQFFMHELFRLNSYRKKT